MPRARGRYTAGMDNRFIPFFFILGGLFGMSGAYFQWKFFFAHRKAQWMTKNLGMKNTRIFYFLVGLAVFLLGWGFLLGWITMQS